MTRNNKNILNVKDLRVSWDTNLGDAEEVNGSSFYINKGESLSIVGGFKSGKSVMVKSLLKLSKLQGKVNGSAIFKGKNLLEMTDRELEAIRGNEISIIFNNPDENLNPAIKIGNQIIEVLIKHKRINKYKARDKAIDLLKLVGIVEPEIIIDKYPHELTQGLKQRIMIAIAFSCDPKLLIAEEATRGLDITVQHEILNLLIELQKKTNIAMMLVTYDLRIAIDYSERILIMYGGVIVEEGTAHDIINNPSHPYTWILLQSIKGLGNNKLLVPIERTSIDLSNSTKGCPFASKCEYSMVVCKEKMPEKTVLNCNHNLRCWLQHEMAPRVEKPILGRGNN